MTTNNTPSSLLSIFEPISDQVDRREIEIILTLLAVALKETTAGSVVEFGCYIGTTSLFIQRYLQDINAQRKFHVYDSFDGLPEKTPKDFSPAGEQFVTGALKASKKEFILNFKKSGVTLPVIHKAWFDKLQADDVPDKICFAFLDGDYYESIRHSLRCIESHLVENSIIVIDDYQSESLPGAKKATDEWLKTRPGFTLRTESSLAIIRDGRGGHR